MKKDGEGGVIEFEKGDILHLNGETYLVDNGSARILNTFMADLINPGDAVTNLSLRRAGGGRPRSVPIREVFRVYQPANGNAQV